MPRGSKERARDRIAALATRGLDLPTFWREVGVVIADAVPHYMAPCWFSLDAASHLITGHFFLVDEAPFHFEPEWFAQEYVRDDVHTLPGVVKSGTGISTLHEAAGGDPTGSPRWHENMELGGDQEVIVALRTVAGEVWGALNLYREPNQPMFDTEELAFLRSVAPHLAEGARRGLLIGEASDPEDTDSPGLVVLNERWEVESLTPGAERWLEELPEGDWQRTNRLPPAVLAVAGQALRTAEGQDAPGQVAVSRVLSNGGRWVVLHGASLISETARRVAVILEPAHPARLTPLLMRAYGLSDREQEVTRLVLAGNSTAEIAASLFMSPHTVQDHLKKIFEKTGVRSRRELSGRIFLNHYAPRVEDNDRRVEAGKSIRGGPFPDTAPRRAS